MQGLGLRLKARARELGITDSEVARRVGIGQPRYANYVNDTNEPDLGTLARICRALKTSPDVVMGFAEPIRQDPEAVLLDRVATAAASIGPAPLEIGGCPDGDAGVNAGGIIA